MTKAERQKEAAEQGSLVEQDQRRRREDGGCGAAGRERARVPSTTTALELVMFISKNCLTFWLKHCGCLACR